MKKALLLLCLLIGAGLGSCQCSDKPEIGPVEEPEAVSGMGAAMPATG